MLPVWDTSGRGRDLTMSLYIKTYLVPIWETISERRVSRDHRKGRGLVSRKDWCELNLGLELVGSDPRKLEPLYARRRKAVAKLELKGQLN